MTDGERTTLLVGLPESGKSTYLGALYYLLRTGRDEALRLSSEPAEKQYLQELENNWLRYQPFERSRHPGAIAVELDLIGAHVGEISLEIPDISGETYSHLWEDGLWSQSVLDLTLKSDGLIVFLHPQTVKKPELIDVIASKDPGSDKWVEWLAELSPTQAVLCDLLEQVEAQRGASLPRIAVVISAWDTVADLGIEPNRWLELEVPLLWQWLYGQEGDLEFRCFGISAQGGDVSDEETRKRLAEGGDPLKRITEGPGTDGLLDPLLWLLAP
ncbi:MAG TPA: hypothetical protein VMF55_02035 [Solirubrobacterales bacterium]|nr:hypothetical protein [Solirubrobacterales bacterium]